ncbi:hypothetical protein MWU58_11345 [Flavobacteriaceae bacterium S0825]|uniref:CCC motif membrane protein n=1 Tax=Gaetbulibacter sp. S0825 TaxID=2720084 RepID=UPI00142FE735|nr:CCC motif membrane protein [Gaetbulibacter sp. S0825]MCK0109890.1 hypothetical protein [Flavobacteriaceae bacterium S0825]NIX65519.1 hypothetical protein [Gaetbulibacter sp. S0825]
MEKQKLNTTLVYILAILGFLCCCIGGIGFIFAGIAFYIAHTKLKEAYANPENYENIDAMKTAKTVALVALIISSLYFLYNVYWFSTGGWDEFMMKYQEAMEEMQRNQ